MEQKQVLIAKMIELLHLFEGQNDVTSRSFVKVIKDAIDKVADKGIQGVNIAPLVKPIGHIIRTKMNEDGYQLTLEQKTVLFDMENEAQDIENKFISGIPNL